MILREPDLQRTFNEMKDKDKRAAAEVAYALGEIHRRAKDFELMRWYRAASVALFEEVGIVSEEDAMPIYERINDVLMPNLIHEGVVVARLQEPVPS